MTKLSVFTRITPTRSNIVTLSKVLKKHGFNYVKSNGKRLFEVVEITLEQVKHNFYRPEQEQVKSNKNDKDITKDQKDNSDPRLPL